MKNERKFRCAHISDIHWRGLTRHEEYKKVFEIFYKKAKELDINIICCTGDIVHTKTQGITPELIEVLSEWFTKLAEIAPLYILLGNHDGLINNLDRQDTISPIIFALNNPNIILMKKSGIYPTHIEGYNFAAFSCFDKAGWDDVKPVANEINIALFHAAVNGSESDDGWKLEGELDINFFDDYDFVMLGDIHKKQILRKKEFIEEIESFSLEKLQKQYEVII